MPVSWPLLLLLGVLVRCICAASQLPTSRANSAAEVRGTVEALLDEFLEHLSISEFLPANMTENPRRLRLKKDAFVNNVLGAVSSKRQQQQPLTVVLDANATQKQQFIDNLINEMTVTELALQMHLMFADNIIGVNSDNGGFDTAMAIAPTGGVGVIHDWYPTNTSQFNSIQQLNLERSRLKIPMMAYGECLHGVGSFRQSMFPQAIGMSASFDRDLAYSVGRAIGTEARAIGIHACLAPVLDLGKDPRWGRVQEAWGEDFVHTALMGSAFAMGLSKNSTWADPDAVVPVLKHFAAHGSPRSGLNAAPFMGRGLREVMQEMLVAFKAGIDLGGARGVMMAYHELDEIPASVHPVLYGALAEWGFDGFTTADDTGMAQLFTVHRVAASPADAIAQWFNAGGMVDFYDFPIDVFVNSTVDLVNNGTVLKSTLQDHVRKILSVKYDLGLFDNPFIADSIDAAALTVEHTPLTLDAAHKSIVLLENRDHTLPLDPAAQGLRTIALIGPFSDILNYGDYAGQWGMYPTNRSSTVRQAMRAHLASSGGKAALVSSWGADTWTYNGQYNIPAYLLEFGGVPGMRGTYFADTNFSDPVFTQQETPNRDWGLYPPPGLPSNNFSVVWEGTLTVPVDGAPVDGWIGVAVGVANCSASLFVDGARVSHTPASPNITNVLGNILIPPNNTQAPPGGAPFTFVAGATHQLRVEFQAFNKAQKIANSGSLNAQVELFWNLVDRGDAVGKAVDVAKEADVIVLAVGANWNSDGENGDRATLGLSPNQTVLADAIFDLGKPVVLVLQGGRPFAIPEYYSKAAAVINAFFPGQSGGQAISDVLFGEFNPGGRVPLSVPFDVGTLPVYYNYKTTAHVNNYTDETIGSYPVYSFGYGLSYTTFSHTNFNAEGRKTFSAGDTITFAVTLTNTGRVAGSYVPQVYLLRRVAPITVPVKQFVAGTRVYLEPGERTVATMSLEVDRFLQIINRENEWELQTGNYTFALLEDSSFLASTATNVTLLCV